MLSLPRARVQSLVRELRFHKPCGVSKRKKKKKIILGIISFPMRRRWELRRWRP